MGGGLSRQRAVSGTETAAVSDESRKNSLPQTHENMVLAGVDEAAPEVPREPTSPIDARIVQTLRELNLARRSAESKGRAINFERIVLRFGMARDAFETIHCIYYQFAGDNGLDFAGLKAVLEALGAHMNESDMHDIFYESDMVRDNSLSHNEFVVSLAISHLLGLIKNFDNVYRSPEDVLVSPGDGSDRSYSSMSARADAPAIIAKTLDLVVTAYLLFDDDASGTIQIGEVRNVMEKHNESMNRRQLVRKASDLTTKAIRAERIKEMDINSDGTITFQEFVLTFQKWVGIDETDEVAT